jgi:hypothetical protein
MEGRSRREIETDGWMVSDFVSLISSSVSGACLFCFFFRFLCMRRIFFAVIIPGLRTGYPYFAPPGLLIIASTRVYW